MADYPVCMNADPWTQMVETVPLKQQRCFFCISLLIPCGGSNRCERWQRLEVNLYKAEHFFHVDMLQNHYLELSKAHRHVKTAYSFVNLHPLSFKHLPDELKSTRLSKALFPFVPENFQIFEVWGFPSRDLYCYNTNNCVHINAYSIQYKLCYVCVCVCFFLSSPKLNKRPVSHLAGY